MIFGESPAEFLLLIIRELESESLEDPKGNAVLKDDDVAAFGVDPVAPENIAGVHIDELGGHAQPIGASEKSCRKDRVNSQVAARLPRIDILPLVFRDDGTGPHDQRAKLCQLGDHGVGKSEFVKV